MATTENGIYYPNDYSKKADVPNDMKKMAESIDPIVVGIKQNIKTLQQEQQTQNTNISNLQKDNTKNKEDITELQKNKETVNTQIQTLQEEIKELEQDVKANAIIEETEKEKSLYISDASGARGRLDVLGNVEQEVTETSPSINYPSPLKILGDNINLFNKDTITENAFINTDGNISNQEGIFYSDYIEVKENEYFSITGRTDWWSLGVYNADKTFIRRTTTTAVNGSVLIPTNGKYIRINAKMEDIDKIKVEKGSIATSYSPYGQGSTAVKIINNNILDSSNYKEETVSGRTLTINQNKNVVINGTSANPSNFEYVINLKVERDTYITIRRLSGRFSGGEVQFVFISSLQDVKTAILNSTTDVSTVKLTNGNTYSIARVSIRQNVNCENLELGLEIKTNNTNKFEEHQEQSYILDIQQPMLKWDYFDLERKKEVHVTNKIILDGTKKFVVGNPAGRYYLDTELNNLSYEAISNCFKQGTENTFNVDNTIVLQTNRINLMNKEIATAEEFDNAVLELYNAGTPIEIYYPTTEPTELDLTESQIQTLEQLNKLRLYKGVNNIFTLEDIALLQATYSVDIQTKLNNINNQLLEMGGSKKRRK